MVYADRQGPGPGLAYVPGTLRYYLPDPYFRPPSFWGRITGGGGRGGGLGYADGGGDGEEKNNTLPLNTSYTTNSDYNNTIITTTTAVDHPQHHPQDHPQHQQQDQQQEKRQRYLLLQTHSIDEEGDTRFPPRTSPRVIVTHHTLLYPTSPY